MAERCSTDREMARLIAVSSRYRDRNPSQNTTASPKEGCYVYSNELWNSYLMFYDSTKTDRYEFDRLLLFEDAFIPWQKVIHPVYGEIEIGGFDKLNAPFVGSYIHAGNKIATLAGLSAAVEGAAIAAKDVAMQAAAMNPVALNEEGVDDKEIEIAKDQLRQEGKPEAMLDNIAKGKLRRFFKDNTLVNQDFIKDSKQSVAQYVKSVDADLTVTGFTRVALG